MFLCILIIKTPTNLLWLYTMQVCPLLLTPLVNNVLILISGFSLAELLHLFNELFEDFGMRIPMKGLALSLSVSFKHHVFEDVHKVIDTRCIDLRMIVRVSFHVILGTSNVRMFCWSLSRVAGHVDYCERCYGVILLPKMQLDEKV